MMISYRTADLLKNIQYRDVEVVIVARVGESQIPTERYFVLFERPESENEEVKESMDSRLRGILEAKSYKKVGNNFLLSGIPIKAAAEQEFTDVLNLFKSNNAIISVSMDPLKYVPGTRTKLFVMRMRTRG